jgi:hypothetical protein
VRDGQAAALEARRRLIKPVFEDKAFKGDEGPAALSEAQAQKLFDEMCVFTCL